MATKKKTAQKSPTKRRKKTPGTMTPKQWATVLQGTPTKNAFDVLAYAESEQPIEGDAVAIKELRKLGLIEHVGRGLYILTGRGLELRRHYLNE